MKRNYLITFEYVDKRIRHGKSARIKLLLRQINEIFNLEGLKNKNKTTSSIEFAICCCHILVFSFVLLTAHYM